MQNIIIKLALLEKSPKKCLTYSYYYEMPSKDEGYNAYIGKEGKQNILVYKKLTNIYCLPTYDVTRIVFVLPKCLPKEEIDKFLYKVDLTSHNLYRIKKSIDSFVNRLLSEWRWDNNLKKIVDAIIERRFEEATSLFKNIITEKNGIGIPGAFVSLPSCVFKIPQISINTNVAFIIGHIIKIINSMADYKKNKALVDFFLYKEEKEFYE